MSDKLFVGRPREYGLKVKHPAGMAVVVSAVVGYSGVVAARLPDEDGFVLIERGKLHGRQEEA